MTTKWFRAVLGEDDKPGICSSFRIAPAVLVDHRVGAAPSERRLRRHIHKLVTFAQSRRLNRRPHIGELVTQQAQQESNGIAVDDLELRVYDPRRRSYDEELRTSQASLIFESEDAFKFMIIEDRQLVPK